MKKTHTYYIQEKVGGKQEEVKDDGEDGTTFSCMCGSFCSDLGQLEKERDYYKCGAIFVDGFYRFQL